MQTFFTLVLACSASKCLPSGFSAVRISSSTFSFESNSTPPSWLTCSFSKSTDEADVLNRYGWSQICLKRINMVNKLLARSLSYTSNPLPKVRDIHQPFESVTDIDFRYDYTDLSRNHSRNPVLQCWFLLMGATCRNQRVRRERLLYVEGAWLASIFGAFAWRHLDCFWMLWWYFLCSI